MASRLERVIAVRRGDHDNDRCFSDGEPTVPVQERNPAHIRPTGSDVFHDSREAGGHLVLIRLVLQRGDPDPARRVIPNVAGEGHDRPAGGNDRPRRRRVDGQRVTAQADPVVAGGRRIHVDSVRDRTRRGHPRPLAVPPSIQSLLVFEASGTDDDGRERPPLPAAADRLWRHPSELAAANVAARSTTASSGGHRFSLGTVVVAGSLGAVAMLGALMALGVAGGNVPGSTTAKELAGTATPVVSSSPAAPPGVVSVKVSAGVSAVGIGLVVDSTGAVVTMLRIPKGAATTSVFDGSSWSAATILATDATTGLTVIQAPQSRQVSAPATAAPVIGQTLTVVGVADGLVDSGTALGSGSGSALQSTARVINTSSCAGVTGYSGSVTVTGQRLSGAAEVALDHASGRVSALLVSPDDDETDEMGCAFPADLAIELGRQIVSHGRALHGTLAASLSPTADGAVGVVAVNATTPASAWSNEDELQAGDEIVSVDGRPVHDVGDVDAALLGAGASGRTTAVVRRDHRLRTVGAEVVAIGAPPASTSLP